MRIIINYYNVDYNDNGNMNKSEMPQNMWLGKN